MPQLVEAAPLLVQMQLARHAALLRKQHYSSERRLCQCSVLLSQPRLWLLGWL